MRFKHSDCYGNYFGSQLGKYIPSICVGITDLFDWEEFFVSNNATTISTELIVVRVQNFEVTLNATHSQHCYDIDYSRIERYLHSSHILFILDLLETNVSSGSRAHLIMSDSCKCNLTFIYICYEE